MKRLGTGKIRCPYCDCGDDTSGHDEHVVNGKESIRASPAGRERVEEEEVIHLTIPPVSEMDGYLKEHVKGWRWIKQGR